MSGINEGLSKLALKVRFVGPTPRRLELIGLWYIPGALYFYFVVLNFYNYILFLFCFVELKKF